MTIDEAIQHCREKVQEQAKKGFYSCAEEHQQLAEWLKELKAYREQDSVAISNLAMSHILNHEVKWINERMTREDNPNTCEDAISRKAAIDLANELKDDLPDDDRLSDMVMSHNEGILDYQTKLSLLPSVTPHQRAGRWIEHDFEQLRKMGYYRCSECNIGYQRYERGERKSELPNINGQKYELHRIDNYCPNCGAKMEVKE